MTRSCLSFDIVEGVCLLNREGFNLCSCTKTTVVVEFSRCLITLVDSQKTRIESYIVRYRCFSCEGLKPYHKKITRFRSIQEVKNVS